MRFFLVGRDRGTGDVRIVSGLTFTTRQEALDSLSTVAPDDCSFDDCDLFVVDLEAVTPVVFYRPTAPAEAEAPIEEPIADVWEAPADEPLDAALSAGLLDPVDESAGLVAARPGDEGLADALRRAAGRMESEGIQPAATVEEVLAAQVSPESEEASAEEALLAGEPAEEPAMAEVEEVAVATDDGLADELDALASVAAGTDDILAEEPGSLAAEPVPDEAATSEAAEPSEEAPETDTEVEGDEPVDVDESKGLLSVTDLPAPDPVAEEPAGEASWPWEPTGEPLLAEVVEPASEQFRPSGIDEPAAAVSDMLPTPEDDFTPRPVIMGDYADAPAGGPVAEVSDESSDTPAPEVTEDGAAPVGLEELGLPAEWLEEAEPVVEAAGDVQADEDAEPPAFEPEAPAAGAVGLLEPDAPAYQPTTVDLDSYTCDDCVYTGTCPKAGQDSPATCGSFQWKSV